jgi:hypothetical protein
MKTPSAAACIAAIITFDFTLRIAGIMPAVRLARRLGGNSSVTDADARQLIAATGRRIATISAFYPRRSRCFEQSFALFVLLRRRGVPVELQIGVQHSPFTAHAWVEWQGRPLNESEEFVTTLAAFPSFGG